MVALERGLGVLFGLSCLVLFELDGFWVVGRCVVRIQTGILRYRFSVRISCPHMIPYNLAGLNYRCI